MRVVFFIFLSFASLFSKEITIKDFEGLSSLEQYNIKVEEFKTLEGLYLLKAVMETRKGKRGVTLAVSKDLKYTFLGRVIDNDTGEMVYIKNSPLPYKKDASFIYGSGKDEYYIFTDPQCPYCKRFEKRLSSFDLKDKIKIYYFLFPLSFHNEALPMSRYILSRKNDDLKVKALHQVTVENSDTYKKNQNYSPKELGRIDEHISLVKDIVKKLGVTGTPTILKPDGSRITAEQLFKEYNGR